VCLRTLVVLQAFAVALDTFYGFLLTTCFPVPTVFFEEGWAVQHLFKAGAKKTTSDQGLSSRSS
jgi:hypothetical protein